MLTNGRQNPHLSPGLRGLDYSNMSSKEIVKELLAKLPEDASLDDIAAEIEFVAGIREGLAELDAGKTLTAEQMRAELRSWMNSK
jgi:predicted transcriptional regulator